MVLLAAHNGEEWIEAQINSILGQRHIDVRVVVSDDGSTDATFARVAQFESTGRVRLVSPCARTGSGAQNFLFLVRENAAEDCDLVAFSDQDDVWSADRLHRAHQALEASGASGYSSAVTAVWENGRSVTMSQSHAITEADFLFEGAGQGCTFVLRAAFYQRLRAFFVEHRSLTRALSYHDWAVYALARVWNLNWFFDPHPTLQYRQHDQNDTGARYSLIGARKRLGRIASGWYRGQIEAVARLCVVAAPDNTIAKRWLKLHSAPSGYARNLRLALFCLHNGRRKMVDNAIVVIAALVGRI